MESSYQHVPQNPDDSCDRSLGDYPDDESLQSGGYDGYNYREYRRPADSLKGKLEQKYWKGKQTVIEKFGKSQDMFVVAGDAEVDARLEAFRQIQKTCIDLLKAVEIYQKKIFVLSQEENESGRFLREQGSVDKTKAGKMMISVGKSLSYTAQQRLTLRVPLVRLYQEVETFHHRAVGDTWQTVNRMERLRSEYRAALLWMADISKQLDPEEYRKLDKYREVQSEVKVTKKKFDKCKVDVIQKVDLLSASRCNLLSATLVAYQQSLLKFWENTSASLTKVYEQFRGHPSYQFQMLKHIIPDDSYTRENDMADEDIKEERITEEVHVDEKEENGVDKKEEEEVGTEVKEDDGDDDTLISLSSSLQEQEQDDVGMLDLLGSSPPKTEQNTTQNNLNQSSSAVIQGIDDLLGLTSTDSNNAHLSSFTGMNDVIAASADTTNGSSGEDGGFLTADDLLFNSPTKPSLSDTTDDGSSFTETWNKMFGDNDITNTTTDMKSDETMDSPTNYLPSDLIDNFDNLDPFSSGPQPPPLLASQPLTGGVTAPARQAMTSPNIPTQHQGTTKATDGNLATWLNLFSDLDPLSNPDAIGQNNEENDAKRSC